MNPATPLFDAPFAPHNRLEELLLRLGQEAPNTVSNQIYDALMEAELALIIATSPAELRQQTELYGAVQDAPLSFPIDEDGNLHVYSSAPRAQAVLDDLPPHPIAEMKYGLLILKSRGALAALLANPERPLTVHSVIVNPNLPLSVSLPVRDVLRTGTVHDLGGKVQALDPTFEPRTTPLPERYALFASAVRNFCEQRPDVLAAYVGMVQVVADQPAKPFVWYYTRKHRPLYSDSLEAIASRLYHARNAVVVRAATARSAPPFHSPADLAVYFSRYGIEPLFQRLSS